MHASRSGKHMGATFLIFAALCLLGSATPLNVIDTAMRSQVGRIVRVYRTHDLLADGVPVAEGAADALTAEEKRTVYESWRALWRNYDCSSIPKWAQTDDSDFERTFGFTTYAAKYEEKATTSARFYLSVDDDQVFDVSAFSHLKKIEKHNCIILENGGIVTVLNEELFDLTDALTPLIPQEDIVRCYDPLIIPVGGGKTLILTYIDLTSTIKPESDDDKLECRIGGYLCW